MWFNPLKTKLVYILFKNSVLASKRTPQFSITKIAWLMWFNPLKTKLVYILFKNSVRASKRIPHSTITKVTVYSENHAKPINTKWSVTDCQSRWFI
jgi:hypothetical protein